MDYEKLYKDTINKLQEAVNSGKITAETARNICADFIPESEDERIRKELLAFAQERKAKYPNDPKYVNIDAWIDWLEKQNQNLEKIKLEKGKWYFCIEDYHPRADCTDFYQGEKYRCEKDGVMGVWRIKNPEKYFRECETPTYAGSDAVRIQSIIQVLEYARSLSSYNQFGKDDITKDIAWLEKQGTPAKLSEEEQNRFAKGVLTSCALSFIDYLDAHKYEGKMCVSNGECEDIENAFHNAMWDRLHRYYCKYIKKQGEQKPADKIEPDILIEESYQQQADDLIDMVTEKPAWGEKYIADVFEKVGLAKIVREQSNDNLTNALQDAMIELSKFIPQPNPAWSEEDEKKVNGIITILKPLHETESDYNKYKNSLISWLKDLKDRVQPQPKQEWSEDVESAISLLKSMAEEQKRGYCPHNANHLRKAAQYLETFRPQTTWKPSETELRILEEVIDGKVNPCNYHATLHAMLEQLKKLREE